MSGASLQSLMDMTGRRAVVTGASGHLGRIMAQALAEMGCALCLVDRQGEALEQVASQMRTHFAVDVSSHGCDLESEVERSALITTLDETYESIHVLVNNAAFVGDSAITGWAVDFAKQSVESWRRAIEVNATAPFHLSQGLLRKLSASQTGAIVNIGSIYGVVGPDWQLYEGLAMANPAAYALSKGGLTQFTRWLATTCAPHVRVNMISPGGIHRGQDQAFVDRYVARTPMRRMASEDDFIGAVAYLASDMSRYVTGQNLIVDGGWTAW